MEHFTGEELAEAIRSIASTIGKSEKALTKLKEGTFQHTMTVRGIKAYYMAVSLLNREAEANDNEAGASAAGSPESYTKEELAEALQAITSAAGRCENILPKLKAGSSQHTLTVRRIKAFHIAAELVKRESNLSHKAGPAVQP